MRKSSQPPAGSAPCSASHALMCVDLEEEVRDRRPPRPVQSSTAAGAISWRAGTCDDIGRLSRPVTQWIGASKCVPVCSPVEMLFQYQAGPRSSYRLISVSANGQVWPNGSGSARIGVVDGQRRGEVDDLDGARTDRGDKIRKQRHGPTLRHSTDQYNDTCTLAISTR